MFCSARFRVRVSFLLFFSILSFFLFYFFLCLLCSVCFVAYALTCLFLPLFFLFFFLFFFFVCFFPAYLLIPDVSFCAFCSACFLLRISFHMFSRLCFVLYVLFRVFCTGCFVPVRPSAPTITTCSPNGTVPANTAVSCTCTTGSVGQPQGRLKCVKVADGSQISVGGYGSTTLQMTPQTLTLSDHGVNKFRCDVDWVEDVTGQSFRASVGCE